MATAARQTNALAVCVPTIGPRAIDAFKPRPALSRLPPVHRADPEGRQRVDMTRAPSRRRMAGICAHRTAGVVSLATTSGLFQGVPHLPDAAPASTATATATATPGVVLCIADGIVRIVVHVVAGEDL